MRPVIRLLAALMLPLAAQGAPVQAELKSEALLARRAASLGELAHLRGEADAVARLAALPVGAAPRPGYVQVLSRTQLARLVRAGAPGTQVAWSGAEQVRLQSAVQPLAAARVLDPARAALEAALRQDGRRVRVHLLDGPGGLLLPPGRVEVRPRPLAREQALAPRVAVWVDLFVDDEFYSSQVVRFGVQAHAPVLAARHGLRQGALAACADLEERDADLAALPGAALEAPCALAPMRLRRSVDAGAVLLLKDLQPAPAVAQGDVVVLQLDSGAIRLEEAARALADGGVGQEIPVQPAHGRETVRALVTAPGRATIARR